MNYFVMETFRNMFNYEIDHAILDPVYLILNPFFFSLPLHFDEF
jgi:hypothetical protein